MAGHFISFEGGEGVGKSTQIRLLHEWLVSRGIKTIVTREPGGSDGAELIRGLLLSGADDRWSMQSEALLFAAARADHVQKTIMPALENGYWVLSDRYIDSSRAYQGVAAGLGDDQILKLHQFATGGFMPDTTILLELPEEETVKRLEKRDAGKSDRIGGRPMDYHRLVVNAFQQFAKADPKRFMRINANNRMETVLFSIIESLKPHLPATVK